jgi:hypothetical protein
MADGAEVVAEGVLGPVGQAVALADDRRLNLGAVLRPGRRAARRQGLRERRVRLPCRSSPALRLAKPAVAVLAHLERPQGPDVDRGEHRLPADPDGEAHAFEFLDGGAGRQPSISAPSQIASGPWAAG